MSHYLTLRDFNIPKANINLVELEKGMNESSYIHAGVELFKELMQYVCIASCIYKVAEKDTPTGWTRNEAILAGLLIRGTKIASGFLEAICNNRMELANILQRSLTETMINLKYILTFQSDQLFDDFVIYSLRSEKKLYEIITNNIAERGYEIPIEKRMKRSISRSFEKSGISLNRVNSANKNVWGGSIFKRFKDLGLAKGYHALFGIQSHFVHGNWQELLMHHLDYQGGKFTPRCDWSPPRPQPIFAMGYLIGETTIQFLEAFSPECNDRDKLRESLRDCVDRINRVDELHEKYLQRSS